jgi:adenylate cyclase
MENTPTGGAEVEVSLLFADIRGSTTLAEGIPASEYARLLNRFYAAATIVMVATDALIDKFVGDEVIGLYVPGFAGPEHARLAVQAARDLLHATGHGSSGGPWIQVGAGVHTGRAFVGKVGSEGVTDITALGDAVNIAARLASQAKAGEILVSDSTYHAAGLTSADLEQRNLYLKGRSEPVDVRVLKVAPA